MEFVSLETSDEANHLLNLCRMNVQYLDEFNHVGGFTTVGKSRDHWYWINSGNHVDYALSFGRFFDFYDNKEFCLSIGGIPEEFLFNDIACYEHHEKKFICQKNFI